MPKKILVVDDSPTELKVITGMLGKKGYNVITASDGEEGVAVALKEKPDLIVLDVVMPKKNGFQVCRSIKTNPETQGIKVVLLTSKDQESDKFWGMKQGADEYLVKPVKEEDLLTSVARHV